MGRDRVKLKWNIITPSKANIYIFLQMGWIWLKNSNKLRCFIDITKNQTNLCVKSLAEDELNFSGMEGGPWKACGLWEVWGPLVLGPLGAGGPWTLSTLVQQQLCHCIYYLYISVNSSSILIWVFNFNFLAQKFTMLCHF